jgi:hypothetical protein
MTLESAVVEVGVKFALRVEQLLVMVGLLL